jgi:hypothetical protein
VRILKLSLKVIDVVPFVPPDSCALRPAKHPLTLSLKAIQVRLSNVTMVLDRPLQPPRPGPVSVSHDGVVNLLALAIEELRRDPIPGVVYGSLAASDSAVKWKLKLATICLGGRGLVHACGQGPAG